VIDFRYHLVSIVSIFLALAVGIVLGAGPLQGQIGDTLTSEITQLRADKTSLRDQVTTLEKQGTDDRAYAEATLGRVVSGALSGRAVALVVLPDVDADRVTEAASAVTLAGGTIASTTRVQGSWIAGDTATKSDRAALVSRLATSLGLTVTAGSESVNLPDRVLAAALASTTATGVGQEAARAALTELTTAKLIEVEAKDVVPAQLVVVLSGPITAGTAKDREAAAASWLRLAQALDTAATASVLTTSTPTAASETSTSLVTAARADGAASKAISTVDDTATPMGQASLVLALVQQEDGATGHYGTGDGASAPFAPLPDGP